MKITRNNFSVWIVARVLLGLVRCGHLLRPLLAAVRFKREMNGNMVRRFGAVTAALLAVAFMLSGCKALGLGKFLWLEKTTKEENYWLLKDVCVTPGSSYMAKRDFDHNMNPIVNVLFTPRNEKNHYVAETMWIDPVGQEFRTIRTTHDIQQEGKKSIDRRHQTEGTQRVHTMRSKDLYDHKPGLWRVRLYLDGELARILEFVIS